MTADLMRELLEAHDAAMLDWPLRHPANVKGGERVIRLVRAVNAILVAEPEEPHWKRPTQYGGASTGAQPAPSEPDKSTPSSSPPLGASEGTPTDAELGSTAPGNGSKGPSGLDTPSEPHPDTLTVIPVLCSNCSAPQPEHPNTRRLDAGEIGTFVEGCWTEQGGVHLRIEEQPNGRIVIVFERGPGGERLASASIASFRRERIAKAIAGRADAAMEADDGD